MSDMEENRRAQRAKYEADTRPPASLGKEEFLAWRSPREVQSGPKPLDNQTWHWLVRTRLSAYSANERFEGPSSYDAGPGWCFDRFGMSQTLLPDGRAVYIAGEHEDHYDPDFYIYNDVVVVGPDDTIQIYGYSREQFPATDFHSATLVGNSIYVIGCLGYPEERIFGVTPIYRLSLSTWCIERVPTSGQSPGWIHRHEAQLSDDGHSIVITGGSCCHSASRLMTENIDSWSLDLNTGCWARLTSLNWPQWSMHRADGKCNRLWDLRRALWCHETPHFGITDDWKFDDAPNFAELEKLYRIEDGAPPPIEGNESGEYNVVIDGVTVRFTEEMFSVDVLVKGHLKPERLKQIQDQTMKVLANLEGAEWVLETDPEQPGNNDI